MWNSFCILGRMVWLYIFTATLLFLFTRGSSPIVLLSKDIEEISERDLRQIISNAIEDRCLKNANEKAFSELKGSLFNFRCCMLENVRVPTTNEADIKQTLSELPIRARKLYRCLEYLIEKAAPCLNEEEEYVSELFLGAHNATVDKFTIDDGKNLKAAITAFQYANCTPPVRLLPEYLFENCAPKLDHLKALSVSSYTLKQADFCYDLHIVYDCVINGAKSQCNDDEAVVENIKQIFEYLLEFCQNHEPIDNGITKVVFD